MIRSELSRNIALAHPDLRPDEVELIIRVFFAEISERLAANGRVELRGFGVFSTRPHEARTGRNPRTGDVVSIAAKRVPYFKPGKELLERLNVV